MISASLVECSSLYKVRIIFKWIRAGNSLVFFFGSAGKSGLFSCSF